MSTKAKGWKLRTDGKHWSEAYRDPERAKLVKRHGARRYRATSSYPKKRRKYINVYNKRNRVRVIQKLYVNSLKRKYGLTWEQYQALVEKQGGMCAICGQRPGAESNGRLHVDHKHGSVNHRGLLCGNCNHGIGFFKDNAVVLRLAATYLDSYAE